MTSLLGTMRMNPPQKSTLILTVAAASAAVATFVFYWRNKVAIKRKADDAKEKSRKKKHQNNSQPKKHIPADRSPEVYRYTQDEKRPENEVDYRPQGGPKLTYLWCDEPLSGQTLYLGGEVGPDGKIYFIPGHAPRVLRLDPDTDHLEQIGPIWNGKFKWLRGVPVKDIIYGLPCHADSVLRINTKTGEITTIPIPYELSYENKEKALQQRTLEWKYHGGNISPVDGCIYAIPQSALHVLKIDPTNDTCQLVGPELPGKYKWYGGVVGRQDGAIYGITHDSPHVLRITPDRISLHGDFGTGGHKWHGAGLAGNGTVVSVPANADSVLCILPGDPEPTLVEIGDASIIRTGRHRHDRKYKYLGATTGTDGKVYIFPSGSEEVLQVDPSSKTVRRVGPNLYDTNMERISQNKWQNGVVSVPEKCVYGIPLAAESLLRIDCSKEDPEITTWPLPSPHRCLAKFEGAVVAPNGVIYTVPNNSKAVLRIEPAYITQVNEKSKDHIVYRSGIPTLRSSAHRVKAPPQNRKHDPRPKNRKGQDTNVTWLPSKLLKENVFDYDLSKYDLRNPLCILLKKCDPSIVGEFRNNSSRLEDFVVPVSSTWRTVNGGQCEQAQKYLSDIIASDEEFLTAFDRLATEVVLPHLKQRLIQEGAIDDIDKSVLFYYQRPPTVRLQPGPAWSKVKIHNDAEYGHQNGELNFWIPLTDRTLNKVDLWCESKHLSNDFHPINAKPGQVISFHGSSCRHYVNSNETMFTRASLDFRVGVEGFFDPYWQMNGTTDDHCRQEVIL